MEKTIDAAETNRDITTALLTSGIPNHAEEKVLRALERAGVRKPVDELLGVCQRNAVAVRDEFRNLGFDAIVVRGWVVDLQSHIVPRDMGEAIENDVVHWWSEVEIHGDWYTIDLASNDADTWGDLLIETTRPSAYRPTEIDPTEIDDIRAQYDLQPPQGIFDDPL